MLDGPADGFTHAIGNFFDVKFPDWPVQERYAFTFADWQKLAESDADPFRNFPYESQ